MKNKYQEKILDRYHGFEVVRDCFAISRIQGEIDALSQIAAFNEKCRKKMTKKYDELDKILAKYEDIKQ